jgi:hypothetical protein
MQPFIYLFFALFLFATCSKEVVIIKDNKYYLTTNVWKPVSYFDGSVNVFEFCNTDDYFIFDTGNVATRFSGAIKCDPSETESLKALYTLSTDQKLITIQSSSSMTQLMQVTVDSTKLILHDPNFGGTTYTMNFVKK